jgi:hypothetical protein
MWDFVMDKSGAGAGFLRELRFPHANLHSIYFSIIIFTITRGWHNRPGVAEVPIASQTRIKKKVKVHAFFILAVQKVHFQFFKDSAALLPIRIRSEARWSPRAFLGKIVTKRIKPLHLIGIK